MWKKQPLSTLRAIVTQSPLFVGQPWPADGKRATLAPHKTQHSKITQANWAVASSSVQTCGTLVAHKTVALQSPKLIFLYICNMFKGTVAQEKLLN